MVNSRTRNCVPTNIFCVWKSKSFFWYFVSFVYACFRGFGGIFLRMEAGQQQDQWELSKENIQPLKQGRSVMKLNNALEQHKDDESAKVILEERQQFEEELRSYNGEDQLDPWYRYIQWVEQTYPKGGKEGQVHVIIEKCIKKFKGEASVQVRFN